MADEWFKQSTFSEVYQNYMIPSSTEVTNHILTYLENKKAKPFKLAVDVACGTGRSTRPLAPHFEKVIGIDISESQIHEARRHTQEQNVTYQVASAHKLSLKDNSVDLINGDLAVHWFNINKFMEEAARVLNTNGCIALYGFPPKCEVHYKNMSKTLTAIINEGFNTLIKYGGKELDHIWSEYKEVFEAVPFCDKQRITGIRDMFPFTVEQILGFFKSSYMYQEFLKRDRNGAMAFLINMQKQFFNTLGESDYETTLELQFEYFCVLARKTLTCGT
ncbi:putative methyltransferase DDB_G0268948 [Spea bombifrons]|uniref:putative methyltransferase DDB_G0268948 n=1 Tax=Spea bombifrons TaxID=233779 RepID=UPI002349DC98|nr:putative methyltransferase DDB_G0268948 [Spea bombifrons]